MSKISIQRTVVKMSASVKDDVIDFTNVLKRALREGNTEIDGYDVDMLNEVIKYFATTNQSPSITSFIDFACAYTLDSLSEN